MDDRVLLKLFRSEPDRAMELLCDRYAALAAAVARRILPDRPQEVEEITADVMVKVWQDARKLRPETLRGFILTAARNLAVDRWRALRRRGEVPLFDQEAEEEMPPDRQLMDRELVEQVLACSPPDGELFVRHYVLLETAQELAQRFQMTESAVRSRLHRVRQKLKQEVSP